MIAQDIMTGDPMTVTERASVGEAMAVMAEHGIRHLPVVRGDDVVGILSDRDFTALGISLVNDEAGFEQLRARVSQPVTVLMTGGVITVGQDAAVSELIDLLLEERLGALPVVETNTQRLVGIVSYIDVLRAARDMLDD